MSAGTAGQVIDDAVHDPSSEIVTQFLNAWIRAAKGFRGHEMWGLGDTKRAPGIDRVRYLVLRELVHGPQRRLNELAERLTMTPSNLSRIVDHLVGRGLASRTVPFGDRRVTLISATPSARELMAAIDRDAREHIARRLTVFAPEEAEHFSDLFERFADEVERWAGDYDAGGDTPPPAHRGGVG
jgi:DNA-binding MarR family transcriptional regulator